MVKKMLEGKRVLGPIAALAGVAVVCLCVGSLLLVLNYRSDLKASQRQQAATEQQFLDLQKAVYQRCLDRVQYDKDSDAYKRDILDYYRDLHDNILANADAGSDFYKRLLVKVNEILADGPAALERPSDSGCALLKPVSRAP